MSIPSMCKHRFTHLNVIFKNACIQQINIVARVCSSVHLFKHMPHSIHVPMYDMRVPTYSITCANGRQ